MKRMGIFIFYDKAGIVDEYVEVLLSSMQDVLNHMVVIVNGSVCEEGYCKLKKYVDAIFIRENIGFDAGAYKDAFTKFISEKNLEEWDEIVLLNDTFYGPFYPWRNVFDEMENERIDFWGLSRHKGEEKEDWFIQPHIQSYFLVCRKSLVLSGAWREFWENLSYPQDKKEAILNFEIRFSTFFTERDFIYKAWLDVRGIEIPYGQNPFADYLYELIKKTRFPIIKVKAVSLSHFVQIKKAFEYLSVNTDYDLDLIFSHAKRLQEENQFNVIYPFDMVEIEHFYHSHRKIFIYGCGNYGRGMALYFHYKGWKYEGFLVTKKTEDNNNIFTYGDVAIDAEDGVILALGKKAFYEVYPHVMKQLAKSQMLLPKQ